MEIPKYSSEDLDCALARAARAEREAKLAQSLVQDLSARNKALEIQFQAACDERKKVHNELLDLKGKIRVFCRIRPLLDREGHQELVATCKDEHTVDVLRQQKSFDGSPRKARKSTHFDAVFGPSSEQAEVFQEVKGLVQSAVDGYSITIFTYGQTGAGKTHTMYGGQGDERGVAPRTIEAVFERLGCLDTQRFRTSVRASLVELYRNDLRDLLAPSTSSRRAARCHTAPPSLQTFQSLTSLRTPHLDVRKDLVTGESFVENLEDREVAGPEELLELMREGAHRRHTASTLLNVDSSRSHMILTISLDVLDCEKNTTTSGKIRLCDLAGAERLKKSGASDETMNEAIEINRALSALGDVIECAAQAKGPVPYRNHKLTQLLSDSLGGSAKTIMFVNISPARSEIEETLNTLAYASRVRDVTNDRASRSVRAT